MQPDIVGLFVLYKDLLEKCMFIYHSSHKKDFIVLIMVCDLLLYSHFGLQDFYLFVLPDENRHKLTPNGNCVSHAVL